MDDRSIKFKFAVDTSSVGQVERSLDQLIRKAQELAKSLNGISLGGVGGGSGILSGKVGKTGPGAVKTGGVQGQTSFVGVMTSQASVFQKLAQDGSAAMKSMGDSVARGVAAQQSQINGLTQSLNGLSAAYSKTTVSAGNLAKGPGGAGYYNATSQLLPGIPYPSAPSGSTAPHPGLPPTPPGWLAGARQGLNAIGGATLPPGAQQALSTLPGGALIARLANPATALAAVGVGAGVGQAKAWFQSPTYALQQTAQIVATGDSYARKMRMGDTSDMRSAARIAADPTLRAGMEMETGLGGGFLGFAKRLGLAKEGFSRASGIKEGLASIFAGQDSTLYQAAAKEHQREFLNEEQKAAGLRDEILTEGYANARGNVSLQRGLGIGSGRKRDRFGREIANTYVSSAEEFAAGYSQFSPEELVAATAGITSGGGRRSRFNMLSSVLQAGAAGMSGMAHFGGVMGREGGTRGRDMVDIARTVAAKSDVGTASLIADYVASRADAVLMPGAVGAGTLGALAVGTAADGSGIVARQNIRGMASLDRTFAGDRDAWQKAANLSAVIRTNPEASYYAQQFLATKMTASRAAELESGGELTAEEKGYGLTREQIIKSTRGIQQTSAYRVATTGFAAGSKERQFAEEMQKGGTARQVAFRMFAGEDKQWSKDEAKQALDVASLVASVQNQEDFATSTGRMRQEIFGLGARGVKGKMVGDVAAGSRAEVELKTEAELKRKDLAQQDAFTEQTDKEKKALADAYQGMLGQAGNISAVSRSIAEILMRHAEALAAVQKAAGRPQAAQKSAQGTVKVEPK